MGCCQSNTSQEMGISPDATAWVEFENDWFTQGSSRLAYRGTFHGDTRREGQCCVVKVYKGEWCEDVGQYAWKAHNRAYLKADEMAQRFNAKYQTTKPIEFVKPEFTRVDTRAAFKLFCCITFEKRVKATQEGTKDWVSNVIPDNATLAVERYLENFMKFSSNTGYVNPDMGATPSAFSHFTYHATDGEVLVCGLQGARCNTRYRFTSPAVHSGGTELGVYGPTDLGKFGILKFFETHTCNALCAGLSKPKLSADSRNETNFVNKIVSTIPDDRAYSMCTHQLSGLTGVTLYEIKQSQNGLTLEPSVAE